MTGRTHDLAAFTTLNLAFVLLPTPEMTLATAFVAFTANMVGGLAPDLDQSTSDIYEKVRGGELVNRFIAPLFGGHRFISHSLLGIVLAGFISDVFLNLLGKVLLVDMDIVWWAFMLGFISHLATDMFTRDGIPLFFPLGFKIGIPPVRSLRIKTGGVIEKSFIFPGLLLVNTFLIYTNYGKYLEFFHHYVR